MSSSSEATFVGSSGGGGNGGSGNVASYMDLPGAYLRGGYRSYRSYRTLSEDYRRTIEGLSDVHYLDYRTLSGW